MLRYLLKRLGYILVSLFFIVTLTFLLMQAAPGGPFASEKKLPPKLEEQMNELPNGILDRHLNTSVKVLMILLVEVFLTH